MSHNKPLDYEAPKRRRIRKVWVPILTGVVLPIILAALSKMISSYGVAHGNMDLVNLSGIVLGFAGIAVVATVIRLLF